MEILTSFALCLWFALAYGSDPVPCSDLTGTWRNEIDANLTIGRIGDTEKFAGRYVTSVEDLANSVSTDVSGVVHPVKGEQGSLVAFNVIWNRWNSQTAWAGQCLVCDGQEKLYTTWVIRSLQVPSKKWLTTRINQNTFWRVDDIHEAAHDAPVNVSTSDVLGTWKAANGDSVEFTQASEQGSMEGVFKAQGAEKGVSVYGRFDGNGSYSAFGFANANENDSRVWAGHIYNVHESKQLLETSWLAHKFTNDCKDPRKFVKYGMDDYSK